MRPGSVFFMDLFLRSFCADKFSLVFPCAKKLSKVLCSFAIVFLFKYDLWFEYIFRKIFQPSLS